MAKDLNKAKALDALLTENTFTAAAEKAGISRRTLFEYMRKDLDFARAYRQQRQMIALERSEQAARERAEALQAIRDLMADTECPAAVRLRAAERLLDYATSGDAGQLSTAQDAIDVQTGWGFATGD